MSMLKHLISWQFNGGNQANFVGFMVNVTGLTPIFFMKDKLAKIFEK